VDSTTVGWVFDASNYDGPPTATTREPEVTLTAASRTRCFLDGHVDSFANKEINRIGSA